VVTEKAEGNNSSETSGLECTGIPTWHHHKDGMSIWVRQEVHTKTRLDVHKSYLSGKTPVRKNGRGARTAIRLDTHVKERRKEGRL
jgi:hypothetical protein